MFLKGLFLFLYVCFFSLHVCLCTTCMNAHEGQKRAFDPVDEGFQTVVLGVYQGSQEDEPVLDHTAVSPAHKGMSDLFLHSMYCALSCCCRFFPLTFCNLLNEI